MILFYSKYFLLTLKIYKLHTYNIKKPMTNNFYSYLRNSFLFLISNFLFIPIYAQIGTEQIIDSLVKKTKQNISIEEKVNTYNLIAKQYQSEDSLRTLEYTQIAINLAEKNNYPEGEIEAYSIRGKLYDNLNNKQLTQSNYQKAYSIANISNLVEKEGDVLYKMGDMFRNRGESDKALSKYKAAFQKFKDVESEYKMGEANYELGALFFGRSMYTETLEAWKLALKNKETANDKQGISDVCNALGVFYNRLNEYDKVLLFYKRSLVISKEIGDERGIGRTYNNLGKVSQDRGDLLKALEYYQKSLNIKKKLDDKRGMSYTYYNIALVHKQQDSFELALEYIEKGLKINEELQNKENLGYLYSLLGGLHESKGEYDKALIAYNESLKIREELQDQSNIASSYQAFASIYLKLKEYEKGISYIHKSIKIIKVLGEKSQLAQSYLILGTIKYDQKQYTTALRHLNKSIVLAKESEDPGVIRACAEILSQSYEKLGNYKEAYLNHVLLKKMTDSLSNYENAKKIARLESDYEFRQVEDSLQKTNVLQTVKLEKEEIKNRSQRNINIIISITLLIVLIFAFFIYRSGKKQKNLNTQLNERSTELLNANNELVVVNEELHQTQEETIAQRDSIESQNVLLEKQHQNIRYSIRAAQTIQNAILPLEEQMKKYLNDYFLIYRPRDVVSGDFYWLGVVDGKRIIGAIDCTGHGVPGAFMSMIGFTLLNKIVNTNRVTEPEQILENLRVDIGIALRQEQTGKSDGMDAAIISLEEVSTSQTKVTFAGAKRPLWYIENQDNNLKEIKGSKISIGIKYKDNRKVHSESLLLTKGSLIYLGSDGLIDQNNKELRKFGTSNLKDFLLKNSSLSLQNQKELIEKTLDSHMQGTKQRDDILWMGIKL